MRRLGLAVATLLLLATPALARDARDRSFAPGRVDGKKIDSAIIGDKNWVNKSGLRPGITAAQLERVNGGAFKFQGFGADEAGLVYSDGPALKPFAVRIGEKQGDAVLKHFRHEAVFSSRHPGFKAANFQVTFIHVDALRRA